MEALDRHAERFAHAINRLTEAQVDKLSERLLEIGASNRAQQLHLPAGGLALETPDGLQTTLSDRSTRHRTVPTVTWQRAADQITKAQKWWGAGDGLKNASGSNGHTIVKKVGGLFDVKFKPWGALKIADKIGKAAKIGGFALQIGLSGYEVLRDEREARRAQIESERQHAAFVTEIMGHADKIAANARRQLGEVIDPHMEAFLAEINAAQSEILGADLARGIAARELGTIASEADLLLTESSGDRND